MKEFVLLNLVEGSKKLVRISNIESVRTIEGSPNTFVTEHWGLRGPVQTDQHGYVVTHPIEQMEQWLNRMDDYGRPA